MEKLSDKLNPKIETTSLVFKRNTQTNGYSLIEQRYTDIPLNEQSYGLQKSHDELVNAMNTLIANFKAKYDCEVEIKTIKTGVDITLTLNP